MARADAPAAAPASDAPATAAGTLSFIDPAGDDDGPGTYLYPTHAVYSPGSFDLRAVEVTTDGEDVTLSVEVGARVEDPWDSKAWGGNGFSLQMAFVFIDTDGIPGSGETRGLPGLNVAFALADAWDRVVLLSPQGPTRLNAEVSEKAADLAARIVVPRSTHASGKRLVAVVPASALGGAPSRAWGWQVALQSNEGFPGPTELLTRKVNEYEGEHRFGGGTDFDCDPHVLDILTAPARGGDDERDRQHAALGAYVCGPEGDPATSRLALLPMVHLDAPPPDASTPDTATAPVSATALAPDPATAAATPTGCPQPACPPAPRRGKADLLDIDGRIYTKWLYANTDSQGLLTHGGPFYPENYSGENGVGSELELKFTGRPDEHVEAGARIQSRFGALWQDYWENGNRRFDDSDPTNNSGEQLGLDHAAYMKLRGTYVRLTTGARALRTVHVGASDLSMFNAWTVGKLRYTERDSGNGLFVDGEVAGTRWLAGAIALPKLFAGPGWTTGLGEDAYFERGGLVRNPFYAQDWAYAVHTTTRAGDAFELDLAGMLSLDHEWDVYDPDAVGTRNSETVQLARHGRVVDARNGAVNLDTRYLNAVGTVEARVDPADAVRVTLFGAASRSRTTEGLAANGVALNQGFFPMPYGDFSDFAARVRADLDDTFGVGLTLRAELFYIGPDWTATFGARREGDVLLTDGFVEGGQLPTLNVANEIQDFDEPYFETAIGWQGATLVAEQLAGPLSLKLEYTLLGYATNAQNRDIDHTYPSFGGVDGYTDTDLFNYANPPDRDRGRDPRMIYRRDQERLTHLGVLWGTYRLSVGVPVELGLKSKLILDADDRLLCAAGDPRAQCSTPGFDTTFDDYRGFISTQRVWIAADAAPGLRATLGYQNDVWLEDRRTGTLESGYSDYRTGKNKGFLTVRYHFGVGSVGYTLEAIVKDLSKARVDGSGARLPCLAADGTRTGACEDFRYEVVRSKAFLEVAF